MSEPSAYEVIERLNSPLEVLGNLVYLALEDPEVPERIRLYMQLAEMQLETMREITQAGLQLSCEALPLAPALRAA